MAKEGVIVGIDIGTTKICTVVAEQSRSGRLRVLGSGCSASKGLRRGSIVDIDEAALAVTSSVDRAERASECKVTSCYLTISGGQISSLNNRGVVSIIHEDRSIQASDVERAIEAARVINLATNRVIIHSIPRAFAVDGQDGISNPIGMIGHRLDVDTHIVTAALTSVQNLTKCVGGLGIEVEGMVLEPLASAMAALSDEEREMGVVLVDIGGGTTGVAVFSEGSICHSAVLPVGGSNITNDVAVGLRTPLPTAEEIKMTFASALGRRAGFSEEIKVPTFGQGQSDKVSRSALSEIVEARCLEIFSLVQTEIDSCGHEGVLPAGIVLTGGGAQLDGIAELAMETFRVPVRVGTPRQLDGLGDSINGPAYAAAVGLVIWNLSSDLSAQAAAQPPRSRTRGKAKRTGRSADRAAGGLKGWLRAFLP